MRSHLFNLTAAASLALCFLLGLIRLHNSQIRDGSFGLKYRTNPYFHRGYHSFWIADFEISYFAGIAVTSVVPVGWGVKKLTRRPRESRGFEVVERRNAAD
jgi:hypothetical protein